MPLEKPLRPLPSGPGGQHPRGPMGGPEMLQPPQELVSVWDSVGLACWIHRMSGLSLTWLSGPYTCSRGDMEWRYPMRWLMKFAPAAATDSRHEVASHCLTLDDISFFSRKKKFILIFMVKTDKKK